jgi:hypothetical protein
MKNWKSLLALALVFFAGVAVGVEGTRIVVRRVVQQALTHPERVQSIMEHRLTRRLGLDRDQQARLQTILTDARGQLGDLRKQFQPQAATVWRDTDQKIAALLTPEQQAKYDQFKQHNWPLLRNLPSAP